MEMSTRHLQGQIAGRPADQMMGHSGNIRGTSVIYVFSTDKYLKLTLTS